jgi:hypothetical protein
VTVIGAEANAKGGRVKDMAVANGLSGSWQQDIEQAVNPLEA